MIKISKKELKSPDQIWQATRNVFDWLLEEIVAVIIVIAVVFAASVGGFYWYLRHQKIEGQAQFQYSAVKAKYDEWNIQASEAKDLAALASAEADLKKELDTLENEHKSSRANKLANRIRAQMAIRKKDWPQAIIFLDSYTESLSSSEKGLGLYPLALVFEESGAFDRAVDAFDRILKDPGSPYAKLAMLGKARVLRLQNKSEDAKKVYEQFLEKHPDSLDAAAVRGLLASLTVEVKK